MKIFFIKISLASELLVKINTNTSTNKHHDGVYDYSTLWVIQMQIKDCKSGN